MKRFLIAVTIITIQFVSLGFAQEKVKENEPTKPECEDFNACFNAAAMAFGQRDYAGAIAMFTRAAEFGDDNQKDVCKTNIGNAWYNTGLTLSQAGNYEDAIKAFNSALDNGLNSIDLYMFRGYAHLLNNELMLSSMDFREVIKIDSFNERANYFIAIIEVYSISFYQNNKYINNWIKKNPIEGLQLQQSNNPERNCIRSIPQTSIIVQILGGGTTKAPFGGDSFKTNNCGISNDYIPRNIAASLPENVLDVLFKEEDFERSGYGLQKLSGKMPDAKAYILRGKAYLQIQRYANAVEDFTAAIEMSPGNAEAYYQRATALEQSGLPVFAFEDLQKYLELSPNLDASQKQEILQRIETLKSAAEEKQHAGGNGSGNE